ncbi:MAG: hypothetical protein A2498_07510 [Lentisphaerae bacterium RIFOXYC12_FULL_60_16]|nr:MAG: hypothetical protein A2498_07510 [Lentisphaerae bacterium RIFOXYC12_FULL_60_16]OGV76802.1 MAG: hypothetical protein A2340_08050 [Lentisphaerae bacterium RIFOXYB12_FULL_60_10]
MIQVQVNDRPPVSLPLGTSVGSLVPHAASGDLPAIAALVNHDVCSMTYPLTTNCTVSFLTMADPHGWRIYRNSLCYLLARVVAEQFPEASFAVEHSLGVGLYCSFQTNHVEPRHGITPVQLDTIRQRMQQLVAESHSINRHKLAYTDAVKAFTSVGLADKLNLLTFRNPPHIVVHECGGFLDFAHGPLAPHTGLLQCFELIPYPPGFVLQFAAREEPGRVAPFEDQPHLFNIFQEHKQWGRILGVSTVGRLNAIIAEGRRFEEFVQTAEALHEKKVARIADQIAARKATIRFVLIAGPSSAGKTTFAKRLSVQLQVNGLHPLTLATDDYFVGIEHNPIDETGKPDYEHLEAVDLDLFNEHLLTLMNGGTIDRPTYNFTTKQREYSGEKLHLLPDQILIIEGIHGLNPRLTQLVPHESKFRIYISALTQLNVDANNRISTTDNRLMRRMVRDHKYRGHSALNTLRLWTSVRRGEKRWIFPFQKEADATFNSALDYELAILKPLVEPLLMQIKPDSPEYAESRRLTEFLLNFLPAPARTIPQTSILREYIGGSTFRY